MTTNKIQIAEFFNDALTYIDDLEAANTDLRNKVSVLEVRVKSLETTVEEQEDQIFNLESRTAAEILNLEHPEQELLAIAEAAISELGYWRFLQVLQDVQGRLAKYYIREAA